MKFRKIRDQIKSLISGDVHKKARKVYVNKLLKLCLLITAFPEERPVKHFFNKRLN